MMKSAGQLFDLLLAILVVAKIFTLACAPDESQKNPTRAATPESSPTARQDPQAVSGQ